MENETFPDTCTACGQIHALCTCEHPLLLQVADALALEGYDATYEYPGYVSIAMPDGRTADFGDANVDYTANWSDCRPDDGIDFFLPQTATVEELVAAIKGWITTQRLSGVAAGILKDVLAAIEPAEGLHGPHDYVPLMEAIAFDVNQRIVTYRANNGGVK